MCGVIYFAVVTALAYLTARHLRALLIRRHAGRGWWAALGLATVAGAVLGFYCGVLLEYQLTPVLRLFGWPVPGAVMRLEGRPGEEQWVDYVSQLLLLTGGGNVLVITMLIVWPVGAAFWLVQRLRRTR